MCIGVYLNSDAMGYKIHLSLFLVLMKGEFDALLKWPFEHKISMILVGKIISLLYNLNFFLVSLNNGDAYTSFLTTLLYSDICYCTVVCEVYIIS